MSVLVPPPQDELELLIREARARQRRRRILIAAALAAVAGAALSVGAAVPGGGAATHSDGGSSPGALTHNARSPLVGPRVPIVTVGSSGGVTWAFNGLKMWLTTNGGRTWRASAPKHVRDMGDLMERVGQVHFVDRRHGWVFAVDVKGGLHPAWARHAELDWTSDGGHTWHWTIPRGCCGAVSFLDPEHGWFLGPKNVMETTDGGGTWKAVAREPFAYGVPTFVDAEHGVAVVGKGEVYRTSDGGRRWSRVRLPGHASALPNIAAFGRRLVVPAEVIGPPRTQLVVYVSSDGGRRWSRVRLPGHASALPNIAAFGRRLVVPAEVIGPPRTQLVVYVSSDGGASWQARPAAGWVPLIGDADAQEFSAATPTVWYATRWHELAVTRDAGRTWTPVKVADLPPRWTISTISFVSPLIGWGVFQRGSVPTASVLMRTTDGGVHWKPAGPLEPKRHPK
jgi:photosystem II stability/assembly factor-like uncharacterized protein